MKKTALLFISVLVCMLPSKALSQISYNPVSMGLGGGGTSYITGYDALFINPANLQLQEKNYRIQLSFAESGFYLDTPTEVKDGRERINTFSDLLRTPQDDSFRLTPGDRESLLSRHFTNGRMNRQFKSASSVNWFGIKWFRDDRSYAFAVRTRQSSRYSVGRGYYDHSPIQSGSEEKIDKSLSHHFQTLHEISFGYSESFAFLSGLFPNTSRFIIGIAPKAVLSGPAFSTRYSSVYSRTDPDAPWVNETSYSYESSGIFSKYADRLLNGNDPFTSMGKTGHSDLFNTTGIGAAVDLGLTYIFTFGDDLSLLRRGEELTEKSLRLSFSVTDLGIIHYFDEPFRAEKESEGPIFEEPGLLPDTYFSGALLQDFQFLQHEGAHPLQSARSQDRDSYQALLPTSIQAGILFQVNRLKMMGDFGLGLHDNAFQTTKFISYIGTEIRPLSFLPIRAGTRLATDLPGYYSFGAGLETTYFDLNAALQFRSTSSGPTFEPVAASVVALKFYIP